MPPKIILTTVPTGLGHIRVTKALAKALPEEFEPAIMGIADETTAFLYRIISTNYHLRKALEFTQSDPIVEKATTSTLKAIQTYNTVKVENELHKLINSNPFRKVIIVSTHAFIAQKIQKIISGKRIQNPIFHAVVITDDSPQRFWMVDADILFAPSAFTKDTLLNLYNKDKKKAPRIEVTPYPINPLFNTKLTAEVLYNKIEQLHPDNPQKARVCIPVSGAAVQLDYYKALIDQLLCDDTRKECREFTFSVVTREGTYTRPFIEYYRDEPEVAFHIGANDEQTVELYDRLYFQLNPPSIEITKPSEQCFKVLLNTNTIGGPLLLLTDPVGRQEYDNLNFLERHGFMPTKDLSLRLELALEHNVQDHIETYKQMARSWRCLRLPSDPYKAVRFITKCFGHGIFMAMQDYKGYTENEELSPHGVQKIWDTIFTSAEAKSSVSHTTNTPFS